MAEYGIVFINSLPTYDCTYVGIRADSIYAGAGSRQSGWRVVCEIRPKGWYDHSLRPELWRCGKYFRLIKYSFLSNLWDYGTHAHTHFGPMTVRFSIMRKYVYLCKYEWILSAVQPVFGSFTSLSLMTKLLKGRIINELLALFAFHHFTLYKTFYINFNYFLLIKEKSAAEYLRWWHLFEWNANFCV